MRSLELLLASLASCAGGSMVVLLRKLKQPAQGVDVNVRAVRRDQHPTLLTEIAMEFVVRGTGLDPAVVARAAKGRDGFRRDVAERIFKQHRGEISFNYCPKCRGLCRTPKAQQCPHCKHHWHSASVS